MRFLPIIRSTLLALSIVLAVSACKKETPPPAAPAVDPSIVVATPELQKLLKTDTAGMREMADTMRVPAHVELDEQRVARIGAAVTGRVADIRAQLGQRVRRGDVLATLNSTELSNAQLAYLKSLSQENFQQRAVGRAKQLLEADVIGSAELQKRESELAQAQAERLASYDQLRVLGMNEQAIRHLAETGSVHSISTVTSTLDGAVIERKVTPGQVVQPADALFTVADLSHIWLVAEVPEQQAALVKAGDVTEAEVSALGGQRTKGKLIFVSDTVKPETRTVTVRMDVENTERLLKPGMLASMLIRGAAQKRVVVPVVAVVRENNRDYVFVQLGVQRFQLREVKLGEEESGSAQVLEGLKEGETIVTDGVFHLNNERRRKELEG